MRSPNILTGGAANKTNADTYAVTADFVPTDSDNYKTLVGLSAGNFVIEKATLTVTADNKTKILNAPNPSFTFQITGFVNGENASVLTTQPTCTSTATQTSPVGSYPITCSGGVATNYTFNYVAGTLTITYAIGGLCNSDVGHQILQPVNTDGTSVFKQKSTVPAKFRVCDVNGVSIGTPGVVTSFRLIQIQSGTFTDVDEAVDSTTPDTSFRWSATDQQWIFNMSTKNLLANKTYYYYITLNDGTFIEFHFGLK